MKKFFLFAAAALAAMTINAAEWDFNKDTLNTVDAVKAFCTMDPTFKLVDATSSDGFPYVKVNYDLSDSEVAELDFDNAPLAIKFTYKNSSAKTEVLKFYGSYIQMNRKGAKMIITCTAGDVIRITPKSYSKACEFKVTGADKEILLIDKNTAEPVSVTATEDVVEFDTSSPTGSYDQACQIVKIEVGASAQGIEDLFSGAKAVKTVENGQLVIIKNGVKFNALGTKL